MDTLLNSLNDKVQSLNEKIQEYLKKAENDSISKELRYLYIAIAYAYIGERSKIEDLITNGGRM